MKRVFGLVFAIIIAVSASGCDDSFYTIYYPEPVIVQPDAETAHTINGYRDKVPSVNSSSDNTSSSTDSSQEAINGEYIIYHGNKSTKKFHLQTCRYAKNMDKEKLIVFDSYESALSMGYFPCKVCQKED